ncbi:MAG: hypothetical protein R3B47_15650 [Bacteroidia bacterium]
MAVDISATGFGDFERFMVRPPDGPHRPAGTPDPEPIGPAPASPEARLAMADVSQGAGTTAGLRQGWSGHRPSKANGPVFAAELEIVQRDLGNNPTDIAATNAHEKRQYQESFTVLAPPVSLVT